LLAGCPGDGGFLGHVSSQVPPAPVQVRPFRFDPDLVLLITGGCNGMMEVCNCAGPMPGGLARRSGLVLSYRAAMPNTFVLDSGDAFWIIGDDVRNEFVLHGYRQIGYDALVLGDQEWSASPERLRKLLSPGDMACLSSTVDFAPATPDGPIRRVLTRQWGGAGLTSALPTTPAPATVKLAVLSDLPRRSLLFFPDEKLKTMAFPDPNELASQAAQLRRQGYLLAVVCHGDDDAMNATARTIPADLYIRGHTMKPSDKVFLLAGRPAVKAGGAEYVGVLALKLGADGATARITDLDFRLELVDTRWPLDGRLIDTHQAYCRVAMRNALDAQRTKGLDYVSSSQCGRCHAPQYQFWQKTRHASAYDTLARNRRTGDPSCLACHTTGFGTQKGFYTIQRTPAMAGVNCQDCHRFDSAGHPATGAQKLPQPEENVCTTCHTPVTDPRFNYKTRLAAARCPGSKAKS
jgi:hypothetical protein